MAFDLRSKFEFLKARESVAAGGLEQDALNALYHFLTRLSTVKDIYNPQLVLPASAISETAQTLKASAGKLLYVSLKSPAAADDDAVVSFFDNSVLRFVVRVKQKQSIKVPLFTEGAGIEFDTNLTVSAKKANNSTNLDAADRPTLEVLVS